MNIKELIRPNILSLLPYSSARDEYSAQKEVFLDANENPYGLLNRYPDPFQSRLKAKLSETKKIDEKKIFLGNGSDEIIDLAIRIFCNPGKDKIVICPPTYGMYEVCANINNVEIISIPLNADFSLDYTEIIKSGAKMLFLCSPNNPTGNSFENILDILKNFRGIVFVDEAYIDFIPESSIIQLIDKFPNLIVSQTLSKAWACAGIRIGLAYSNREIISVFNKVKPPYNISSINQKLAIGALENISLFMKNRDAILSQKMWLLSELREIKFIKKIFPSDANFFLVETENAEIIYSRLLEKGVVVRNRHSIVPNCLRITVGSPSENLKLIQSLKEIQKR